MSLNPAPARGKQRYDEKRRATRRRLDRCLARILTLAEDDVCPCLVCDISSTGAKLVVTDAASLPDSFLLMLSSLGNAKRTCVIVWRLEQMIGVRFEAADGRSTKP